MYTTSYLHAKVINLTSHHMVRMSAFHQKEKKICRMTVYRSSDLPLANEFSSKYD